MVVTRRQSVAPIPPAASRTNSSNATPRLKDNGKTAVGASPLKASTTAGSQGAGPGRPSNVNGHTNPSKAPVVGPQSLADIRFDDDVKSKPSSPEPKNGIAKSKSKSKSKKNAKTKKAPKEKGITIFDVLSRLTLLFFIVYTLAICPEDVELRSPVCRTLSSYRQGILEPYVYPPIRAALDHPSVQPHVQRIQPYYDGVIKITKPVIRRGRHEWRTKVLPQIRWIQIRARPYVRKAQRQFDKAFGPSIRQLSVQYHLKVAPHVTKLEVQLQDQWTTAKPWVYPLWRTVQRLPMFIRLFVFKPLGQARQQFVDPHIAKIWDSITEQANTNSIKSSTSSALSREFPSSTVPSEDVPSPTSEQAIISASDLDPTPTPEPEVLKEEIEAEATPSPQPTQEILEETETVEAETIVAETIEVSAPAIEVEVPVPPPTDAAAEAAASVVAERLSPSAEVSPRAGEEEEIDASIEKYISELTADEKDSVEEAPVPAEQREETPEEREERLRLQKEETQKKRAELIARHEQWEADIQTLGSSLKDSVISSLLRLRESAVEEARAPNGPVRSQIENLSAEAEKNMKALKAYGKKLENAEEKDEPTKIKAWESVVGKVEKKFSQKLDEASTTLQEWWVAQVNNEMREIDAIATEVYDLATQAQSDLGMDYAWLPDVTYLDWQRYHKLVDTSKQFMAIYVGLQNGTLEDAPANALTEEVEALQEEVDDMLLGWEASLGIVKRAVMDKFSIDAGTDTEAPPASTKSAEPEISILPIGPGPNKEERNAGLEELSEAILNADPVEMREAAGRAAAAIHEEL
ncbi:hypothetical protein M422DRAFT_240259 [Sphaerobolus stellatus SS14]|nr:hypothetical protein M422DRAFT_240259 [Sphaerobolus stellatus SS14]